MRYILIIILFIHGSIYSQNVDLKIDNIIKSHIEDYLVRNNSMDNLLVSYENVFFSGVYERQNLIVLNNTVNVRKYVKDNTYMINFRLLIKDDKLYISTVHFRIKKIRKGIERINQMDGNDYYICDLIDKVGN